MDLFKEFIPNNESLESKYDWSKLKLGRLGSWGLRKRKSWNFMWALKVQKRGIIPWIGKSEFFGNYPKIMSLTFAMFFYANPIISKIGLN